MGQDDRTIAAEPFLDSQRQERADLAASRREMVEATRRMIDWHVKQYGDSPQAATSEARDLGRCEPSSQPPDQVSWWTLEGLFDRDPAQGQAVWHSIRADPAKELAIGFRTTRVLESSQRDRPYDRAQVRVIVDALTQALQPRGALETLLLSLYGTATDLVAYFTQAARLLRGGGHLLLVEPRASLSPEGLKRFVEGPRGFGFELVGNAKQLRGEEGTLLSAMHLTKTGEPSPTTDALFRRS